MVDNVLGRAGSLWLHILTYLWGFVQVETTRWIKGTSGCSRWQCCWSREGETMASYLLHGTLHVTIYEAQDVVTDQRKLGGAPGFIRKVSLDDELVWTLKYPKHPISVGRTILSLTHTNSLEITGWQLEWASYDTWCVIALVERTYGGTVVFFEQCWEEGKIIPFHKMG